MLPNQRPLGLLAEQFLDALQFFLVGASQGDVSRTKADVTRIRKALGWEPRASLRDGLEAMWAWASARVAAG